MLTSKEQELAKKLISAGANNEEIKIEIDRYRSKSQNAEEVTFIGKIEKIVDSNGNGQIGFFEGITVGIILLILVYTLYALLKKKISTILYPFYNNKKHAFLMDKLYFRAGIVLYILMLICIGFLSYAGFWYIQSIIFTLMKIFSYIFIFHQINCFIFFRIIIDFVVLGNKNVTREIK